MKIVLLVFLCAAGIGCAYGTCPSTPVGQYFQLGDWCYIPKGLADGDKRSFKAANDDCVSLDADGSTGSLAVIPRHEVQSILTAMLAYMNGANAWIGLSQGIFQSDFEWVDGTAINYTYWAPYQPDGAGIIPGVGSDCVQMVNDLHHPGRWYDVTCSSKKAYICQVKALDSTVQPPASECSLPGYINFFAACFRLYAEPKTFDEAQRACAADSAVNGFLASVDVGYENAALEYILYGNASVSSAWLGLQKQTDTDKFMWLDGYPVRFTNWDWDEPNSGKTDRACTRMVVSGNDAFWEDVDCDMKQPFFCKSRIGGVHPPTYAPIDGTCPPGWDSSGDNCYLFAPSASSLMNQNRAHYQCFLHYGARLASVHSDAELRFLLSKTQAAGYHDFWIGFERDAEGIFRWQDDTPLDYENWAGGQPSNEPRAERCVLVQPSTMGTWKTANCAQAANYVCMMSKYKEDSPPIPTVCPNNKDWALFGDRCYMVSDVEQPKQTWSQAEEWCNKANGHLAAINSREEQDFINRVDIRTSPKFWIGLHESSDDVYEWSDKSDYISFQNWDEGEPNDFQGKEKCVELNTLADGKWNDEKCGLRQNFICERSATAPSTVATPTEEPPSGGCRPGWVQARGKCFKAFSGTSNRLTRMDAAAQCDKYGADLAMVANSGEQAVLTTLLEPSNETLWIGLSDIGSKNQYHWSDGTALEYTNWAEGRPLDVTGPQVSQANDTPNGTFGTLPISYCAVMVNDAVKPGRWKDIDCSSKSSFACTTKISLDYEPQASYLSGCKRKGHVSFHDSCFVHDATARTFDEAGDYCRSNGGAVATVRDDFDAAMGASLLYAKGLDDSWIGLRKDEDTNAFGWEDSWPLTYTNWRAGQPHGRSETPACAACNSSGSWFSIPCDTKHSTLCKYTTASAPAMRRANIGTTCPDGWLAWGDSCYLLGQGALSWQEAEAWCEDSGRDSYMASVRSQGENDFLLTKAKAKLEGDSLWIRMQRSDNGNFFWATTGLGVDKEPGDLVDFVNWDKAFEGPGEKDKACAEIVLTGAGDAGSGDGVWQFAKCAQRALFVCKKAQTGGITRGALAGIIIGSVVGFALLVVAAAVGARLFRSRRGAWSFGVKDTVPIVGLNAT